MKTTLHSVTGELACKATVGGANGSTMKRGTVLKVRTLGWEKLKRGALGTNNRKASFPQNGTNMVAGEQTQVFT